jgi:hypothetical protein
MHRTCVPKASRYIPISRLAYLTKIGARNAAGSIRVQLRVSQSGYASVAGASSGAAANVYVAGKPFFNDSDGYAPGQDTGDRPTACGGEEPGATGRPVKALRPSASLQKRSLAPQTGALSHHHGPLDRRADDAFVGRVGNPGDRGAPIDIRAALAGDGPRFFPGGPFLTAHLATANLLYVAHRDGRLVTLARKASHRQPARYRAQRAATRRLRRQNRP